MSGLAGSCHCGRVTLELAGSPVEAAECNCSLCRRLGTVWHYCAPEHLSVEGETAGYVQGDRTLTTWHCPTCASVTHWTALDPDYSRVGVNLRMFDPAIWSGLPRRLIDGASF